MSERIDVRLRDLLREAAPPVGGHPPEHDLWPAMSLRMRTARLRVSTLDWLLAALLVAGMIAFPRLIPGLLYHL